MMEMRPEKFTSSEEGVLISFQSYNDCTIKLSNGSVIRAQFVWKQRMNLGAVVKIDKKYFIAIYENSGPIQGRILTMADFKYDQDIRDAISSMPNYHKIL